MTLLDLTTRAKVKERLDLGSTDGDQDSLIEQVITAVSLAVERYCDREFYSESRTEYHHVDTRDQAVSLRAYPITSITSIKNDADWDWTNTTAETATNYDHDDASGLVYFLVNLEKGKRALQVVYTGGIETAAADVVSNYPDLADIVTTQAAYEVKRRDAQGAWSVNLSQGGGVMNTDAVRLLPGVKERLSSYRRIV